MKCGRHLVRYGKHGKLVLVETYQEKKSLKEDLITKHKITCIEIACAREKYFTWLRVAIYLPTYTAYWHFFINNIYI